MSNQHRVELLSVLKDRAVLTDESCDIQPIGEIPCQKSYQHPHLSSIFQR